MYERASGVEIRAYYDRVMYRRLVPSGQVRVPPKVDFSKLHKLSRYFHSC